MTALPLVVLLLTGLQSAPLQIVVLKGEDAVNVIQQKTAVAPLVEIRDRNNQPVAGAVVTFSIKGAVAQFPGAASSMTVVTNAAGQAVASAVTPIGAGSFSIQVEAAFQGQSALATIAQSNVLTAQAASGASAATGSAASGGAAGGGGLSATTIGIIGAAVGGGALAATQLGGGSSDTPAPTSITRSLTAPLSTITVHRFTLSNGSTCTIDHALNGTVTMDLTIQNDVATGTLRYSGTDAQVAATCQVSGFSTSPWTGNGLVSGTKTALSARAPSAFTTTNNQPAGSTLSVTQLAVFEGTFDGTVATGTFSYDWNSELTGSARQTTVSRVVVPLTLR